VAVGLAEGDGDAGCFCHHAAHDGGPHGQLEIVGHADGEAGAAGGGVEGGLRAHGLSDQAHALFQIACHGDGARGGLHAAVAADEQRVLRDGAQACQRSAQRGLAEREALRGARHAAFLKDRQKGDGQRQVEPSNIVQANSVHREMRFAR
jgi:hypothetical protein